MNVFRKYLDGKDIIFPEITVSLLDKFNAYLTSYMILIRTVFDQAITNGLVDQKYYPFDKGKIGIKLPEANKIELDAEEIKLLEESDLSSSRAYWSHARNSWLGAYYFAGMRTSDVLRLKHSD